MFRIANRKVTIGNFSYPLSEFQKDEPDFEMPDVDIINYVPGRISAFVKGTKQSGNKNYNWAKLDEYIAKEDVYRAAFQARKEAQIDASAASKAQQVSNQKESKIRETDNELLEAIEAFIEANHNTDDYAHKLVQYRKSIRALDHTKPEQVVFPKRPEK